MRTWIRDRARRRSGPALAAGLAAAALVAGCGGTTTPSENADTARGREIFTQKCGACHVLADARTQGQVGPNLDDAFKYGREQGFDESTFYEVTLTQLEIPAPPMPDFDEEGTKDYLSEQDRVDIAAYVAEVAGQPGQEALGPETTDPKAIYTGAGCGSCHTLGDAGTTGTVGPNLDESNTGFEEAMEQIAKGGGGMPAYEGRLTDEQIKLLAEYIVEVTGG